MTTKRNCRGFSLMELLVVVAIIGVLSLVTVPMFINFQRRNQVRSALRDFTTVLRKCRQDAIAGNRQVRLQAVLPAGEPRPREYQTFFSTDNGASWTDLEMFGAQRNRNWLPETIYFSSVTFPDNAVTFRGDGTITPPAGNFVLLTEWQDIINQVTVSVNIAGQVKATEAKAP